MSTEGAIQKNTDEGGAPGIAAEVISESRPIFAIFEGGGAKGIAHVGAYAAADEMGLEFVGVAGAWRPVRASIHHRGYFRAKLLVDGAPRCDR